MRQMQAGGTGLPDAWVVGVILGFTGAILDFYSGYLVLTQSRMVDQMGMEGYTSAGLAWGIGVISLGIVLAITTFASVLAPRMGRMGDLGALMIVYGLAMLFVGGSMYLGVVTMTGAFSLGLAMLAVGVLMMVNGALMRR